MDRSREVRRSNMAALSGLSRRRHRTSSLRDSPEEEEGQIELQRGSKREKDRDLLNRRKRRKGESRYMQGRNQEDNGEESTEESFGDEEEYEAEDGGGGGPASRIISQSTTSWSSSSFLNQNHRKILPPPRVVNRSTPQLKAADEMIGVPVPRKARSASVKRSHESWASGNGGFGEDQSHRRASTSPASRSTEAASSSSLNASTKKKLRPIGPKTRLPKLSKSSGSVQEDIEIEIAEVLFGLKKQSQSSKHDENIDNSWQKPESKYSNGISHEAKSSSSGPLTNSAETTHHASVLPQNNISESNPAPKKLRVEAENSPIVCAVKAENGQPAKDDSSPKVEKISGVMVEINDAAQGIGAAVAAVSMDSHDEAIKQKDSKLSAEESCIGDRAANKEKSISSKEESASKLDIDSQNSTVIKTISNIAKIEPVSEEKFKIDLMAPPPMVSSPEREGFIDTASDLKPLAQDGKMAEHLDNDEVKVVAVEGAEDKKTETIAEKGGLPRHDLEKLNQDGGRVGNGRSHKQQQLVKADIPKLEKTSQSGLLPLPIAVTSWPNGLTPLGYMPPVQTVIPSDGSTGSSAVVQPSQLFPLQLRSKRCATHHYIARNIYLHQQSAKVNNFWPAMSGSTSLAKSGNVNFMASTEKMIIGNPLQGNFPVVNLNSVHEKAQPIANIPGFSKKDNNTEAANVMGSAQKKQLMLQQSPQPASAGNLLHGPTFIFPLNQQEAAAAAASNKSGPSKAVKSTSNAPLSSNSAAGVPATSTALPTVAAAMSFNYPNLAINDAPYYTIVPNNGYPFPISTAVGTPGQGLPLINGSFYSPQMFHHQLPQKKPHSQPPVQPAQQNTSTSSGSSSSHKQTQMQHPRGAQVSGNNYLTSANVKLHPLQKQPVPPTQQSRKLEAETSGESTPSVADKQASNVLKGTYGPNFTVPLQPVNFALIPSRTVSGGGNQGEKQQQQQSQQKSTKGGVELTNSQPFAMPFASFNGGNTPSNLNFSSMAQNPAIFQSFPDMVRLGYQVTSAPHTPQQKNHMLSEGKIGGSSANHDEGKKTLMGKSPASMGQTLVFDNSARILNFVSSPVTGTWPPRYSTSTAITTNSPCANNSQQQQLLQLQKQHNGAVSSKASTTNNLSPSSTVPKFSTNYPISSQTLIQCNSSAQSSQWSNSAKVHPPTSVAASNSATIKNVPPQQLRATQGHAQLSFAGSSKSALASQGQAIHTGNQSSSPLVVGSPTSGGNLRSNSAGGKGGSSVPTLQQSQQTENSSASTGQKSSPVCGRNVPSILSACPSHLSELKY